jgi:cellobiose-specific phosphotransferase system component IIC
VNIHDLKYINRIMHRQSVLVHGGQKNPHTLLSMFVVDIGIGATLFLPVTILCLSKRRRISVFQNIGRAAI